jgi:glutamate 5-kinase
VPTSPTAAPAEIVIVRRASLGGELNLQRRSSRLEESQAAAAAGQIVLAHAYQEILRGLGLTTAQVLLTLDDSERRERYLNASKTLRTLLAYGAVPVINENDTVATQELRYGDNDRLSARVAQMVSAECLVLLSDVDGLYTADPRRDENARYVEEVTELTREGSIWPGARARATARAGCARSSRPRASPSVPVAACASRRGMSRGRSACCCKAARRLGSCRARPPAPLVSNGSRAR